jgi:hypothetical protein
MTLATDAVMWCSCLLEVQLTTPNPQARCLPGLASYAALLWVVGAEEGAVPCCVNLKWVWSRGEGWMEKWCSTVLHHFSIFSEDSASERDGAISSTRNAEHMASHRWKCPCLDEPNSFESPCIFSSVSFHQGRVRLASQSWVGGASK